MNGGIGLQDGLICLLQFFKLRCIGRNIQRSGTQPSQGIDLTFNRGVAFTSANPDYAGLVVFHHEPSPYFAKAAGAANHNVNTFLSVEARCSCWQDWCLHKLLVAPFSIPLSQTVAPLIRR